MTEGNSLPNGPRLPRRIMAIWCRRLALDRWRHIAGCAEGEGADTRPLALISETAHGPRIEAANAVGIGSGVMPGMLLADARAICPGLATAPADPAGNAAFMERLALRARRWGPWSAFDPPDGVLVDVTGVAHVFGSEEELLKDAEGWFLRGGIAVHAAIAPTAGAAWALAHHGSARTIIGPDEDIAACLAALPVAALRLDEDVLLVLRRLGLKRLGDLRGIGRDALARRFRNRRAPGASPLSRLDQLLGRVPEPLLPVVAIDPALARRRLLEPVRHRDLLDRVVRDCADDLARVLEEREQGARRLECGFWRVDGEVVMRHLEFSVAMRDPDHLCRLLSTKLDDVDAGFGIEMVVMRAVWTQPLGLSQEDFEASAKAHGTSLATCIDRLTARLGADAVRRPVMRASHVPERAQAWVPPLAPEPPAQGELAFHARPLKLLDRAEPVAVIHASPDGLPRRFRWRGMIREVVRAEGPERIAPEWWRERAGARLRDYYRIEDAGGCRYWIYRHGIAGDGRGGVPEWFLHGLYG